MGPTATSIFFFFLHNFAGHISVLDEKKSLLRPHHALQSGEVRSSDLAPEESGALVHIYLEPSISVFRTAHVDNDVQGEQPRGRPSSQAGGPGILREHRQSQVHCCTHGGPV